MLVGRPKRVDTRAAEEGEERAFRVAKNKTG